MGNITPFDVIEAGEMGATRVGAAAGAAIAGSAAASFLVEAAMGGLTQLPSPARWLVVVVAGIFCGWIAYRLMPMSGPKTQIGTRIRARNDVDIQARLTARNDGDVTIGDDIEGRSVKIIHDETPSISGVKPH